MTAVPIFDPRIFDCGIKKQFLMGVKERIVPVYYFRDILHVIGTVKPQQHAYRKSLTVMGTVNRNQRILRELLDVIGVTVKYKQFHDSIPVEGRINILRKRN